MTAPWPRSAHVSTLTINLPFGVPGDLLTDEAIAGLVGQTTTLQGYVRAVIVAAERADGLPRHYARITMEVPA